jgi:hypothetical protein
VQYLPPYAGVAELADAQDLKFCDPKGSCGFDPRPRHLLLLNTHDCTIVQLRSRELIHSHGNDECRENEGNDAASHDLRGDRISDSFDWANSLIIRTAATLITTPSVSQCH